ncbi:hypothetical protein JYP52_21340 [Nitratireductor aquibiodomus]|uniref:hypothetical protein n=1 Tax=Nitratireductor aquibiodomus TaxID=204799 RepID=UPI0019D3DE1D|nr:hypothetical protein [Nitratireductor aquibiodomus]MBN7763686.1 hypothetical protein [Nitratireductor aquibiodomus]
MPETAYSTEFRRELDPQQLLELMRADLFASAGTMEDISEQERQEIKSDVICSSCGVGGAQIVRTSFGRSSGRAVRKPHFRFEGPGGEDAHRRYCEFGREAPEREAGWRVSFASARTEEARFVRSLVCKGIERKLFDQSSIRAMRQWFYEQKAKSRITIPASPERIVLMQKLDRHYPHVAQWPFSPVHAEMPNFNWREAAMRQFTEDNREFLSWYHERARRARFSSSYERAKSIVESRPAEEAFDRSVLREQYEKSITLSSFVAANSEFPHKNNPAHYRSKGAPTPLLALSALVLFISDWSMDEAIGCYSKMFAAPDAKDNTLGNVMGLNPFHDFDAWEIIKIASELAERSPSIQNYDEALAAVEKRIREEHRRWRSEATRQPL